MKWRQEQDWWVEQQNHIPRTYQCIKVATEHCRSEFHTTCRVYGDTHHVCPHATNIPAQLFPKPRNCYPHTHSPPPPLSHLRLSGCFHAVPYVWDNRSQRYRYLDELPERRRELKICNGDGNTGNNADVYQLFTLPLFCSTCERWNDRCAHSQQLFRTPKTRTFSMDSMSATPSRWLGRSGGSLGSIHLGVWEDRVLTMRSNSHMHVQVMYVCRKLWE